MDAATDLKREQLYELVWSVPMRALAARFGVSDVALAKLCRRRQVPVPSRGYWAKKRSGRHVGRPPLGDFVKPTKPPKAPPVETKPAPVAAAEPKPKEPQPAPEYPWES